jgi:hypothetical protein
MVDINGHKMQTLQESGDFVASIKEALILSS